MKLIVILLMGAVIWNYQRIALEGREPAGRPSADMEEAERHDHDQYSRGALKEAQGLLRAYDEENNLYGFGVCEEYVKARVRIDKAVEKMEKW